MKADPGQLQQVIMNLAVNARDAMPKGGRLLIETASLYLSVENAANHDQVRPGTYVMLAMSDNGMGMAPEVLERIFEPFFTTKEQGKGTGLGLSTVYGIVKQSGGYVAVYSEPGQGSTFKVYLPACVVAPAAPAETPAAPVSGGVETILVAEDDAVIRGIIVETLQEQGYTTLDAEDGLAALAAGLAHPGPIHLLVTDVVMPRMGGPELARQLTVARTGLQVLFVSGYTDRALDQQTLEEKGFSHLRKPFSPDSLARRVREILDAASAPAQ